MRSSRSIENSLKNLSGVSLFFLDGGGRYIVNRRKLLFREVTTKSWCSKDEKPVVWFCLTARPFLATTATPPRPC